jgi:vacuolar-type H+-ATPase subunit E/Vma4
MNYKQKIHQLIEEVPKTLINLEIEREKARKPTQASSNFITNKEQGDWAENLVQTAINQIAKNHIAVKYGKSDDRVAGQEGFDEFYQEFQEELDSIGKRPDLLIFKKSDYNLEQLGLDISKYPRNILDVIVPQAIAGLEIRSSSFLINKYDQVMQERCDIYTKVALDAKNKILNEYLDLLETSQRNKYIQILNSINQNTLSSIDFRVPNWRSSEKLIELTELFKTLKEAIKEIQKRDFLSITPKVEDLKVVYNWIQKYNVPHYYFQVFFDKIYGISYQSILKIISDSSNEGNKFFIEGDVKNQNKMTIKINVKEGLEITDKVDLPDHQSKMKELGRGRLIFYVKFYGGNAYLNLENLLNILQINYEEF